MHKWRSEKWKYWIKVFRTREIFWFSNSVSSTWNKRITSHTIMLTKNDHLAVATANLKNGTDFSIAAIMARDDMSHESSEYSRSKKCPPTWYCTTEFVSSTYQLPSPFLFCRSKVERRGKKCFQSATFRNATTDVLAKSSCKGFSAYHRLIFVHSNWIQSSILRSFSLFLRWTLVKQEFEIFWTLLVHLIKSWRVLLHTQ